ncbi:unnamed protein product [Linum tenue]|uniref:Uncharacterized protein n=2 Tax=Linum tenue TaxID=586396 RepID=A0AAV0HUA5_9ROSI|nr:unnamed protein product [Linum tenue]
MIPKNRFRIPLSLAPFFNHSRLKLFFGAGNKELYGDKNEHYETSQRDNPPLFLLNYLTLSSGSDDHHGGYFGSFPKFLYYQTNLQVVDISNVKMKGGVGFPWWLVSNNTNLKSLNLQNCSLSGSIQLPIHHQDHRQKGLEFLDISDNEVYGSIPPHICAFLPNITYLYLSNNQLSGKIPKQLSNCSLLMWLDARNNTLSGEIPRRIWNMPRIGVVDLSSNSFSGTLPPDFISPYMQGVYLSRNKLGGSLSEKEYVNYDLQVLDLGHNRFTGTFPTWIVEMPRLTHLLLNDNELQGEILPPLCLGQLKLIDDSHNQFFGRLSSALTSNNVRCNTSKKDEVYFIDDLEFTTKSNRIIYKGEPLILMSGLDFSNNHFFGEIPPQIGHLDTIKVLNLSYNMLTGPIPPTFSGLISIETLDISHNNLSGVILTQLTALNYLSSFSVAYNNLSGKCPKRVGQFGTFDEDSYRGNPHLMNCTLLQSTPKPYVTQTPTDDEYGGYIDIESFYTSSGVSFVLVLLTITSVLYINPYWRQVWFYYVRVTTTTCYYFVVDHLPVSTRYKVWEPHV